MTVLAALKRLPPSVYPQAVQKKATFGHPFCELQPQGSPPRMREQPRCGREPDSSLWRQGRSGQPGRAFGRKIEWMTSESSGNHGSYASKMQETVCTSRLPGFWSMPLLAVHPD